MFLITRCVGLVTLVAVSLCGLPARAEESLLTTIAFGSCAKQDQPQPIWQAVVATGPQLFVFLGDNIYGDTQDMDLLRRKWNQLADQPGLQALRKTCRVIGTWDDHDYGADDAGAEYPRKRESQQLFLDFLQVPPNDPRRTREGVYSSQVFGPVGQRVQVILLDARYHRSPQKKGFQPSEPGEGFRGKYLPNTDPGVTVLGETQWAWLAEQLRRAGVDFAPVPPRYRSTYFSHVFTGGYSAGYYSYLWSEVLDADTVEWFRRNGEIGRAHV